MTTTPSDFSDETLREEAEDLGGSPGELPGTEPGEPDGDGEPEPPAPERVRTGSDRVDDVIRAVEELDELPIEEHVGVFESAQVQLRRALDDPGESVADDPVTDSAHSEG
jgi:hypothetical protein